MTGGCYTALITPFINDLVDYEGLDKLIEFQIQNRVTGILAVGTTGESPTLAWDEHNKIIEVIAKKTAGKCKCIAGTGSNSTNEALSATRHAVEVGVDAVLLVDPYYNGPSSLEIRKEYIEPVAKTFPDMEIIPYIIPGRTGAQLLPEDLAILAATYGNINSVKEATGNLNNMARTREITGDDFTIFSGDDALVFEMMTDPSINASGVISVASNIVPGFLTTFVGLLADKKVAEAEALLTKMAPLFNLTTITTSEITPFGEVECRARNPLGIKTAMALLGMPAGNCRRPLGKMTRKGVDKVISILKRVNTESPEILEPIASFFNVNIHERLANLDLIKSVIYTDTY